MSQAFLPLGKENQHLLEEAYELQAPSFPAGAQASTHRNANPRVSRYRRWGPNQSPGTVTPPSHVLSGGDVPDYRGHPPGRVPRRALRCTLSHAWVMEAQARRPRLARAAAWVELDPCDSKNQISSSRMPGDGWGRGLRPGCLLPLRSGAATFPLRQLLLSVRVSALTVFASYTSDLDQPLPLIIRPRDSPMLSKVIFPLNY